MRPLLSWDTCATSADCLGVARQPYGRCLHHLEAGELADTISGLTPGQAIDLRGTLITAELLDRVLGALSHRLGRARFELATFLSPARFADTLFTQDASFDGARFDGLASFYGTRFERNCSFRGVRFAREVTLHGARVRGHLSFEEATIANDALFGGACVGSAGFQRTQFHGFTAFDLAHFHDDAIFRGARFWRSVSFRRTGFEGAAAFESARFMGAAYFAPATVARRLDLSEVSAQGRLEIDAAGCPVLLRGARVLGRLIVRLADADLDLGDLVCRGRSSVTRKAGALRVLSLERLDAEELTIDGADLSRCRLPGVASPEKLTLRDCVFATTPHGTQLRLTWPSFTWARPSRAAWLALAVVVAMVALLSAAPQHPSRRPIVGNRTTSQPVQVPASVAHG